MNLFLYGTLQPGGERWQLLLPNASGVVSARTQGALYDTGRGYPGACFDEPGVVHGSLVTIEDGSAVLEMLDRIEAVAAGLYRRRCIAVETEAGSLKAWAYEYRGDDVGGLRRLPGGAWPVPPG